MPTKNQHYVPQVYLRGFAVDEAKTQIWCFDKSNGRRFLTNVRNVASETWFYTLDLGELPPGIVDPSLEGILSQWETDFAIALEAVRSDPTWPIVLVHRSTLARFMASQLFRTPLTRSLLGEIPDALRAQLQGRGVDANLAASRFPDISGSEAKRAHIDMVLHRTEEAADYLEVRTWQLFQNDTGRALWTSDMPVVVHSEDLLALGRESYAVDEGVQHFLPLAPDLVLVIAHPSRRFNEGVQAVPGLRMVDGLNEHQVRVSQQRLFAASDDFAHAERILIKRPELANPDRPTIWTAEMPKS